MPPSLALLLWLILLLALFRFDPAKERGVSPALWVPLIWLFIVGSRLPSQWFGAGLQQGAGGLSEGGNLLDRRVYFAFILLAFSVLSARSFDWRKFLAGNVALTALLCFGLLSVVWSDFPLIAFKRWFRDLGIYLVILVALTDPHPIDARRT